MRVHVSSLWQQTVFLWTFSNKTIVSGVSVYHFLRMITLINKIGSLSQNRMGIGTVTYSSYGHMRN